AAHEIAKELNEAHKEEDDDYLFVTFMAGNSLKYITDFEFLPSGIAVHYDNSGAPVALNAFEHEKTAMMLQTMAYYFEQEIARNDNLALLNFWRGNFFAAFHQPPWGTFFDNRFMAGESVIIEVVAQKLTTGYARKVSGAVDGVASWSEH